MTLRFNDRTIGGFSLVQDGPYSHLYYSQTLHASFPSGVRSSRSSIGHAVSEDLSNWEILPDALQPSDELKAWDNTLISPGSIIKQEGLWYFYYTGASSREDGLVQRVGLAFSEDLINWQKNRDNPVIEADKKWYLAEGDVRWGDPWIFNYEGGFHAFITARQTPGYEEAGEVIAQARSLDLLNWEVLEPAAFPQGKGVIHSPELEHIGGRWYLFFNSGKGGAESLPGGISETASASGLRYQVGESPLGPFDSMEEHVLINYEGDDHRSFRVIRDPAGSWVVLSLSRGKEVGVSEFGDPIHLIIGVDGSLVAQKL